MSDGLRRNVWLMFVWRVLRVAFAFAMPTISLWWQQSGLTLGQTLWLQALFAIALGLSELPTGFIADQHGRRQALIASAIMLFLGGATYVFASTFWSFVVAEVFLGLGFALSSGADQALLVDSLRQLGRKDDVERVWHRCTQVELGAILVMMVVGGFVGSSNGQLALIVVAAMLGVAVVVSFAFVEAPYQRTVSNESSARLCLGIARRAFVQPDLRLLLLIPALIGAVNQPMAHLYTAYWVQQGNDKELAGVLFASLNLACLLGALVARKAAALLGEHAGLYMPLGALGASYCFLGWDIGLLCVIPFAAQQFVRAFSRAVYPLWLQQRIEADRATIGSVQSMLTWLLYAGVMFPLGAVIDNVGIRPTLSMLGVVALLGALTLWQTLSAEKSRE